jgi:hypothetical protein
MVTKNKLHWFLSAILSLTTLNVSAECYSRSSTVSKMTSVIERVADLDRQLLPISNNRLMCRITFRAYIDGKWHDALGEEVGRNTDSLDTLCSKAMNSGRISILESVSGTKITGNQEMICTDRPKKEHRSTVSIGDLVWESEVQIHPVNRNTFNYRGSICRWFVESKPQAGRVELMQGIICRAPEQKVFRVVDKW